MAKPGILQRLTKGWLLSGKNFPGFADTFNYAVDRIENLKGDFDTNPKDGYVTVDNTDPEHPVIRLAKIPEGGGGSASVLPGCFDLDDDYNFINRYYRVEQFLFELGECSVSGAGLYYIFLPQSGQGDASVESVASVSAYNSLAANLESSVIPLYLVTENEDGTYSVVDLRNVPTAAVWSVTGASV